MSSVERSHRARSLFAAVLEQQPHARAAFLTDFCGTDVALRGAVEELLARHEQAESVSESSAAPLAAETISQRAALELPEEAMRRQGPLDGARFAPGHIFASRFRIVSLLGRGGMGEVYRADDLRLGHAVALKLLTPRGSRSGSLTRFIAEVRLAREVGHPNVCRVYDIGEAEGWDYLSMEYVDGETLASLLRRIGRLPDEKALDVARQVCAGLVAAHDRGVLHRDLKPSNIMLDGRGRARIMDFGLAVSIGQAGGPDRSGTPAYMAPEQIAGGQATERTDVYALGLVLFELFTGRMIFPVDGGTMRREADAASVARACSGEIAPPVHAIICRCLDEDPARRPASMATVAAALPGGDPLAATIAEGRVPSPEMVGAAGGTSAMRPAVAALLLAGVLAGALAVGWKVGEVTQLQPATVPKPVDVLADRAKTVLLNIGYGDTPVDTAFWFKTAPADPLDGASRAEPSSAGVARSGQMPIWFVYRQSPRYLLPQNFFHVVTETDPPADTAGMTTVILDSRGRLVHFKRMPSQAIRSAPAGSTHDWSAVFSEAGLNPDQFVRIEPDVIPPVPHDARFAWERRSVDSRPRVRINAAALAGEAVYFDVAAAGATAAGQLAWFLPSRRPWTEFVLAGVVVCAFAGAVFAARRNLRAGQGDLHGARKLSVMIACGTLAWPLLEAHHVPIVSDEWNLLELAAVSAVGWGGFGWLIYIGLEPYVRRWWPTTLIGWTRLMSERALDPIVGREVLAGLLAGVTVDAALIARFEFARRAGTTLAPYSASFDPRFNPLLDSLLSGWSFAGALTFLGLDALQFALFGLFFLVLIRIVVRRAWLAVIVWTMVASVLNLLEGGSFGMMLLYAGTTASIAAVVLLRYGLLSLIVMLLCSRLLTRLPLTLDAGAWYFGTSMLTLLSIAGLATFAVAGALKRPRSFVRSGLARPSSLY